MIDRNQLRSLGWDDRLIEEVLREATSIEGAVPHVASPAVPEASVSIAGSELFMAYGYAPNGASEVVTIDKAGSPRP
jgi:hypothetical protein